MHYPHKDHQVAMSMDEAGPSRPRQILRTEANVQAWPGTPGFRAFWGWVQRRCERIKGRDIIRGDTSHSAPVRSATVDTMNNVLR